MLVYNMIYLFNIGQSICVNCGTILEENTIISNIEFQVSYLKLLY